MGYKKIQELILDSKDVTVGGGSASAMAGATACGLIGMVCRLSTKKDFGIPSEKQLEYAEELDEIRDKLLEGVVEDGKAYGTIIAATKLPKGTDEEIQARKAAIAHAGIVGATAPMVNAQLCRRVYDIAIELEGKTNPNAESDMVIGKELAKLGVMGCLMNIEMNLPLVKDEEKIAEFNKALEELKIN